MTDSAPSGSDSLPLISVLFFGTDDSVPLLEFARAAEARGLDGIVLPEHTHMPLSAATAYPLGDLPPRYKRVLDPYTSAASVAAATGLRVGTCISLVAQHDPIQLAKAIATLDFLSEGRFSLGVGYGWNRAESANHGIAFGERRAVLRENIALMRTLWREEEAEFTGTHHSLTPSWAWPKPARSTVPVLLGVQPTERGVADVVGWADGWISGGGDHDALASALTTLREAWRRAERPEPGPIVWAKLGLVTDDELAARIEGARELGVTQVVLDLQATSRDETLTVLDRYATVLDKSFR